jgi:hypothetical protein
MWKLFVLCEEFEQNCLSTFELAKYTLNLFPVFHYAKPKAFYQLKRLVLTNTNKSVKNRKYFMNN